MDTLGTDAPIGEAMRVSHVLLVMQENRSFDHYFSKLSHGGVDVAPADVTNPDARGVAVSRYHETRYCVGDPDHSWEGSHRQWNAGANDGFIVTNGTDGARALGYYDETDLPWYYGLARTFAISDRHFASLLGPTQPNRLFYFAATSFGATSNGIPPVKDGQGKPTQSLFTRLSAAGVSWKVYVSNVASPAVFLPLILERADHFAPIEQYFADAAADALPQVAIIESRYLDSDAAHGMNESDEHANANMQAGQAFTARVVKALMTSPSWKRSVLFLTYDEHGGFYDHVPPPPACEPDDLLPYSGRFDRYGFRVPLVAVSPFARRGYVSHVVSDHTSVLRFVEARFGLPALTRRDANADALLDLFDFKHPDFSVPELPTPVIDAARQAQCERDFPP